MNNKITTTLETITPTLAAKWLEKNTRNRPVKQSVVDKYAQDMKEGRWQINGESIKFDSGGNILDGQHRLYGVLMSGKNIQSYVVRGLAPDSFHTIDTGKSRDAADILHIDGEKNSRKLAAALRVINAYFGNSGDMMKWARGNRNAISTQRFLELAADHPDIRHSINFMSKEAKRSMKLMGQGLAMALHYLFARFDRSKADEFFRQMSNGSSLPEGSPILALRNKLIDGSLRSSGSDYMIAERAALIIKAWNMYRKNKVLKALRFQEGEDFPTIQ